MLYKFTKSNDQSCTYLKVKTQKKEEKRITSSQRTYIMKKIVRLLVERLIIPCSDLNYATTRSYLILALCRS